MLEHGDVLGCGVYLGLGAEQLGRAEAAVFVGDAGFSAQFVEAVAAVFGQAHHALLVHRVTAGGAVAQHLRHPQVLVDVAGELDGQRRMALEQPLDCLQRYAWRSPGRGIAGRDLACVGEAGFHGHRRLAVDHGHFETLPGQIIGTGGSDYTATKYQNSHRLSLARGLPQNFVDMAWMRAVYEFEASAIHYIKAYIWREFLAKTPFTEGHPL